MYIYIYIYIHIFVFVVLAVCLRLGCVSPSFNLLIFLARLYYRPTSELLTLNSIELVGNNVVRRSSTLSYYHNLKDP